MNVDRFGRLYAYPVDGAVYAQARCVRRHDQRTRRNVVYIATMNDKVYAFDADRRRHRLWTTDFTNPSQGITAVPVLDIDLPGHNISGNVGVKGRGDRPKRGDGDDVSRRAHEGKRRLVQRLHGARHHHGTRTDGSPVTIAGSVAGTAPDSVVRSAAR